MSSCEVTLHYSPREQDDTLAEALRTQRWGLVHVAAPAGGELTTTTASTLLLPPPMLLALYGRRGRSLQDETAEEFVTALLVNGTTCVAVPDAGASDETVDRLAAEIVSQLRTRRMRLADAVRNARLKDQRENASAWDTFQVHQL